VTAIPQPGNPRPRLFRLPQDEALMNRLGFNNHGAQVVGQRLAALREKDRIRIPVGINLGKSRSVDNANAAADYRASFRETAEFSDYVVVNISSPNTPGLRDLQERDEIRKILDVIGDENEKRSFPRPVLLKLAPDLADEDALACAKAAAASHCHGFIISNTSIVKEGLRSPVPEGSGGISGRPIFRRSTEMLQLISQTLGDLPCIGVGGIMDVHSARAKENAGAMLLQVYSGFIYGGPQFPITILRGLLQGTDLPTA
jgi:dihydroorotate dehydrogenase